ncbi:flagellar hook assembly protein FlgD [Shewanella sp. GXUN23E]|uniref:flagellar hook assembly protein FlgD n=1 Tax=Shewanella sp. GXUN23E TaxID=3422498 RepID=UPI003D7C7EEA
MSVQLQANAAKASQGNNTVTPNANDAAALKNEFMTLMIAQIQNQDPTNPMDANEYVSQLATFSQVESLEHMRQNQTTQMMMMENLGIVQSASLIGKNAMVPADSVELDGDTVKGKVYLDHAVESLDIELVNDQGEVVSTINLGSQEKGDIAFAIDPQALGLPKGEYELKVAAKAGEKTVEAKSFLSAPITKIHFISAQGMMMAEMGHGLGTVSVLDISEVS